MRHIIALLLAVLWSFAPVASLEFTPTFAASVHGAEDCKGVRHEAPPAGNPWMLLPGVQEHFLQLGCYFHRQPLEGRPQPWEVGTCRGCHAGNSNTSGIPPIVKENCVQCHFAVTEQQTRAPCSQAWCPIFVQPFFANRNAAHDMAYYIAGMNLNPLWHK